MTLIQNLEQMFERKNQGQHPLALSILLKLEKKNVGILELKRTYRVSTNLQSSLRTFIYIYSNCIWVITHFYLIRVYAHKHIRTMHNQGKLFL